MRNYCELKTSFPPISIDFTRILILGSLPGERSLERAEYYAHPQNRFWRLIAYLTNQPFPTDYSEKIELLLENKIGVWDVVRQAKRTGSLDVNITEEKPNKLDEFIAKHKNLNTIVFNGSKAQKLFDKYFTRKDELKYLSFPSTSPANASFTFERLCEKWREILL